MPNYIGVRTNATDVTGRCAAVQYLKFKYYSVFTITCNSRKMEFQHDRKPIGRTLNYGWFGLVWLFGYCKNETKPFDGF